MADSFDADCEWLGIPPEDQPPDHYRLLGLQAFETDPAAIAEAARRRIARVEKLGGERPAHARAVIERLRAAERSLKTPETKAAYDRSLRERRAGASATTIPGAVETAPAIRWRRWLMGLACGAALAIAIGVLASRDRAKPGETALAHQTAAMTDNSSKQPRELTAQQQATGVTASNSDSGEQPPAEATRAAVAGNGAGSRAAGSDGWPPAWLQLDERGEPCEATLADGTAVKLDTYGETYEAWRIAPPVNGDDCEAVIDYKRDGLPWWSIADLRLDVAGQKMYWIEKAPGHNERIRGAGMDGTDPIVLLTLATQKAPVKQGPQQADGLAIDHERGKMYWSSRAGGGAFGKGPAAACAVWRAGLDGSDPNPLFGALRQPGEIAIEPRSGTVYYFSDLRLMRGGPDGADEAVVIERLVVGDNEPRNAHCAAIDPIHAKIYWCGSWGIARANLDGTGFETVFDGCKAYAIGLDTQNEKIYWTTLKEVWRANGDGSDPELVVLRMAGAAIDVDSQRGQVYFSTTKDANPSASYEPYSLIRRLKRPPPIRETFPAPPIVVSINPPRQRAGAKVEVRGRHFSGVAAVRVIGDDGRQSDAEFTVADDAKLTFVLPPRREGVNRLAIVVEGPGGVTVTLPRDTHAVKNRDGPFFKYDRTRDTGKFCFAVSQDARLVSAEHSVVYAPAGVEVSTSHSRGDVVLFLKDGSLNHAKDAEGIVVYYEPFAKIFGRADRILGGPESGGPQGHRDHQYIPVPAIRPSFVEALLEYEQAE